MWDNAQALRQLANTLLGISLLLVLFGVMHYVVHLPIFPLHAVRLGAVPQRVDAAQVEEVVHNQLRGNFFTVDLEGARKELEKLPWVRKVDVRRQFPWELEVDLEEHVALADWNGAELVNTHGEVFAADCRHATQKAATGHDAPGERPLPSCSEKALPRFIGQPDTSAEVTQMYKAFSDQLAPLNQQVVQISFSPRHAWQLRLDNGMVLELGREQAQERLARFIEVYPYSLGALQRPVNYVDLRYRNGFAAYLPGGMSGKQAQRS